MARRYSRSRNKKRTRPIVAAWLRYTQSCDRVLVGIGIFFFCIVLLIVYRLYHIQVISGSQHNESVLRQYQNVSLQDDHIRGDIYFTYHDGNRLLAATDRSYYQLVINNQHVDNPRELRTVLREHISHDHALLEKILKKENDPYEILVPRIPHDELEDIKANRVRGIELHERQERYYPLQDVGSMVLGFVSFQGESEVGTYGLEKYYDHILRRDKESESSSLLFSLFGKPRETRNDASSIEKHIAKEGSLVSTIEPSVQQYLLEQTRSVSDRWNSAFTAAIVMEAKTGKIVAMADSREFNSNTDRKHYRNVLVEDRYEFGSVMKPLAVAIGLDTETITTNFSYHDYGSMELNQFTINNFDRRGRGAYTTLQTVLTQSLNTGMAHIALAVGAKQFTAYINRLGLGSETGVDLPYEMYGNTDNINTGRDVELATASFGQGVAVTAIEMARAWGALANQGLLETPYLVDVIEYGDLIPAKNIPVGGGTRIFDEEVVEDVTDLLVNIVDDSATFSPYSLPNHSIAIKTGTAQIPNPQGGYYSDQFLHSFAGYFPANAGEEEDTYVVFMFTYKPQGVRYSSTTLKDAFFNTAGFMINYYELTPDRNLSSLNNFE